MECAVLMVVHDDLEIVKVTTLRTLCNLPPDARLVVVDDASSDGSERWLELLAARGDITLLRSGARLGLGPALEQARRVTSAPLLVTLASDAFPLGADWIEQLHGRLRSGAAIVGIGDHVSDDLISPACLMIERATLDGLGVSFDTVEGVSRGVLTRGGDLVRLRRSTTFPRDGATLPVELGASYEGAVRRLRPDGRAGGLAGDPPEAIPPGFLRAALHSVRREWARRSSELTVVVDAGGDGDERADAVRRCLEAWNLQDAARWRYRIVALVPPAARDVAAVALPIVDELVVTPPSEAPDSARTLACMVDDAPGDRSVLRSQLEAPDPRVRAPRRNGLAAGAPRRGDVAIVTPSPGMRWSPLDIDVRGLGGSETAVVQLAECWSRWGYSVTVFGDVDEVVHRDVVFRRTESFDPLEPRLAMISSRVVSAFDAPSASRIRVLWAHDYDYGDALDAERARRVDLVVSPSVAHARSLSDRYPFLGGKLRVVPNGIHHARFAGPAVRRRRRVLYTSSPDRGLDVVLELWPSVRREVPDAELVCSYVPHYDASVQQIEWLGEYQRRVVALADQPGVTRLGTVGQRELARLMRASRVWVAPSWSSLLHVPYFETFCIGAVEAQAAGCWVVASAVGGLRETVRVGRLVVASPGSERWRNDLVEGMVEGLRPSAVQQQTEVDGPRAVRDLSCERMADSFLCLVERALERVADTRV